jgi:hypothetical protein
MFYELSSLSVEELERLYIKESHKYLSGIAMGISYNTLQSLRLTLDRISNELNQRKQARFKKVA